MVLNRKSIREQASDFVRTLVEKSKVKEEPASPSFNDQDQQKIAEIAKIRQAEFSGHQNRQSDFVVTNKLKEKYSNKRN